MRPIIIGGDDITIISTGRLGLEFSVKFIEALSPDPAKGKEDGIYCCGGVAIVHANYPFYRAYELAEQVCAEAKKLSRGKNASLIDFAILHGEAYPELSQLRDHQYKALNGERNLHFGPYYIAGEIDEARTYQKLYELAKKLAKVNSNKYKQLRDVLQEDDHYIQMYLDECKQTVEVDLSKQRGNIVSVLMEERKKNKNKINGTDFWEKLTDEKTDKEIISARYIDAIEIIDYMVGLER
ncbi:MAG: hypothetical protein Q4D21_03065 [Phascolarctobacterium sp.]|nr:hypothetical protein [Phascolarctobacterium sp.]